MTSEQAAKVIILADEALRTLRVPATVVPLIPEHVARETGIMPLAFDQAKSILTLLMLDPSDQVTIEEVRMVTEAAVIKVVSGRSELIREVIERYYRPSDEVSVVETVEEPNFGDEVGAELLFLCSDAQLNERLRAFLASSPVSISIVKNVTTISAILERTLFDHVVIHRPSFQGVEDLAANIRSRAPQATVRVIDNLFELCSFDAPGSRSEVVGGLPTDFFFNTLDYLIGMLETEYDFFRGQAHALCGYARTLGERCGMPPEELLKVSLAAYFNDFGEFVRRRNFAVNEDSLLLEDQVLKEDDTLINELQEQLAIPYDLRTILRYRNERFDGAGPLGLTGNDIPLASRILGLVHVFINEAKFKGKIQNKRESLRIIQEEMQGRFDPQLVTKLEEMVTEECGEEQQQGESGTRRILLLDTKNLATAQMKLRLVHEEFEVEVAASSRRAVEQWKTFRPGLVLLGIDKLNFVERIRDEGVEDLKVILLLPRNTPVDTSKVEGVVDQVTKPVNLDLLVTKVRRAFGLGAQERVGGFFQQSQEFYELARKYKEQGNILDAARMFEKARDFKQAGALYLEAQQPEMAARAYEKGKYFKRAAECYKQAKNYIKQNEILLKLGDYYSAGANLMKKHRWDQAIAILQKVDRGSENYLKSKILLGKAFMSKRNFPSAIANFRSAIDDKKIGKENLGSYYVLAVALEYHGEYEEALKIYEAIYGEQVNYQDVEKRLKNVKTKLKDQRQKEQQAGGEQGRAFGPAKRYKKLEEIGRGGMGVVYKAEDTLLGRVIALKVLATALKEDRKVVDNFLREARSAAALNHANIVTVYDVGIEDGNYFIAMENIEGETLREIIRKKRKGPLDLKNTLAISKQICKGLGYAHNNKIIHRDLTTSNVMITMTGMVKIMDFGLARVVERLMSEQSIIGGTPSFMSPEQVEGDPIDHRSDIYTFGVSMFEMATADVPFKKGDLGYHHLHTAPPSPKSINPETPDLLCEIILKCLQKKPDDRYQSVDEILEDLNRLQREVQG